MDKYRDKYVNGLIVKRDNKCMVYIKEFIYNTYILVDSWIDNISSRYPSKRIDFSIKR